LYIIIPGRCPGLLIFSPFRASTKVPVVIYRCNIIGLNFRVWLTRTDGMSIFIAALMPGFMLRQGSA
jgi:hypothetical protein